MNLSFSVRSSTMGFPAVGRSWLSIFHVHVLVSFIILILTVPWGRMTEGGSWWTLRMILSEMILCKYFRLCCKRRVVVSRLLFGSPLLKCHAEGERGIREKCCCVLSCSRAVCNFQ